MLDSRIKYIQCEDVQPTFDHPGSYLCQTRNQSPEKKEEKLNWHLNTETPLL